MGFQGSSAGTKNRAKIYSSGSQSINNNTNVALAFDTTEYDNNSLADLVNDRIVIANTGTYYLAASMFIENGTASASYYIRILVNGTVVAVFMYSCSVQQDGSALNTSTIKPLSSGDLVTVQVRHTTTSAHPTTGGAAQTYLLVEQL